MGAVFNGNSAYIVIGGLRIDGYFQSAKVTPKNDLQETTAGNVTHKQRAEGLSDYSYDLSLVMPDSNSETVALMRKLKPGTITMLEVGPKGNSTGMPRFKQEVGISECPFETVVEKKAVVFSVKCDGADVPERDGFDGDTF